jgi:ADP-ribose pyrophosphatase YjhB (NUDIX family)
VSPRRIDYFDDLKAPKANSLVPSVNVVVVNDANEILMIRRTDNGNWALPGGAVGLGESVA